MPLAASIVAAGNQGRAKPLLSAPCRLKAAGLYVPRSGSVVRYFLRQALFGLIVGSFRPLGWVGYSCRISHA